MKYALPAFLTGWFIIAALWLARPAPPANVHDDFEAKALSPIWSDDRFVPGAVVIQSDVVRSGHSAARITLHQGDLHEGIDPLQSQETERDELLERRDLTSRDGQGAAYAFSVYLPPDFPIVPTRLVLAQWKEYDRKRAGIVDSPVVALRYVGGELKITLQTTKHQQVLYHAKEEIRGKWLDFVFQLRLTTTDAGRVRVTLNGTPLCDYHGVTAYTDAFGYPPGGRFYFKMGLYRDRMAEPMTAYFDDYSKVPWSESKANGTEAPIARP